MSAVTFSGLASGMDTGSIVSQLVELKRQPIVRLQARRTGFQNQISALGTLKSKLLALQDAAKNLDSASEFSSLKATTSDEDRMTVTAGEGAAAGSYRIEVRSLAVAQKEISQGYASASDSVGQGIVSFTVNGETTDLNLTGFNSLESLKDMINNDVAGVSASIINDGSGSDAYHLVLSSAEAGSAGAFSVDMSGLSGGGTPILANQVVAADAQLRIDDMDVTATSNQADDVISGLTLNLLQAEEGSIININVEMDSEGIGENVKALVDAYNDYFAFVQAQSGPEGELRDNPSLRSVSSRVENVFASSLEGGLGDYSRLAQVGITRGDDRQLVWNADDFTDALTDDFGSVRDLFIQRDGNDGKSYLIDTAIDEMTDSMDGLFKISTDALNRKIKNTDSGIERYERSVESYQLTLERKFTAMEMMVSQLQAQGNYLSSIVSQ